MTKDEAMQMALDIILRYCKETPLGNQPHMIALVADEAIEALRTALAQPEPEPVAWITVVETKQGPSCQVNWTKMRGISHEPLYTAPPQRKPLSEDQIERDFYGRIDFVRAIEAAHGIGEKND